MQRAYWYILLVIVLLLSACSERSPFEPEEIIPLPHPDEIDLLSLLDYDHEGLEDVAAALAEGDSVGAINELLLYILTSDPVTSPHVSFDDPVQLADEIMDGWITLPPHPRTQLPENPSWKEDPFDDINWRFQLHAFRWPMALLYAWEETGNTDYLDRFIFLLEDYAVDNFSDKPASNMTWYDMGAALRLENWLYSWRQLVVNGLLDKKRMVNYLLWLRIHGYMLANEIRYDDETNHGIFHNRALMSIALVLPEFLESAGWYALGFGRLDVQILDLVSPEGIYLEPTPYYHFYSFNAFQDVRNFLISTGRDLSGGAIERIDKMMQFAALILQPNGMLPMLSDCPESIPLEPYLGYHPWLDYSISEGVNGIKPEILCRSWPQSGYVIVRSGWGEGRPFRDETHAVFDTGPKDGPHGHYDGMSFTLCAWGEKLIVDSGYYTFEGTWRYYFMSPEAHNVIVPESGAYSRHEDPIQLIWNEGDNAFFQSAKQIIESRRVWTRCFIYLKPDDFLILDHVSGSMAGGMDQLFHLPPEAFVGTSGEILRMETGKARLDMFQALPCEVEILKGETSPIQGWYSPSYGNKVPSFTARFRVTGPEPKFYTLLHTHTGTDSLLAFRLEEETTGGSLIFEIERTTGNEHVEIWPATGQVERRP